MRLNSPPLPAMIRPESTGTIASKYSTGLEDLESIVSSVVANDFGAWTQYVPPLGYDVWLCIVSILPPHNLTTAAVLEIGIGASGSETPIARISFGHRTAPTEDSVTTIVQAGVTPKPIPAGTRIALRVADVDAVARAYEVALSWYINY